MNEDPASDPQPAPDGGTAGADEVVLDPWGSSTVEDYQQLFDQFGIEEFEPLLAELPAPHYLMRRGVIFGHRGYGEIARSLREGGDAAVLSGFMPTGEPHIGHKMVFDEIVWHQNQGAEAFALIADLEAHAARGLSWTEIDGHAEDYLLSLLALGFDPEAGELYRQSTNREVQDLAFALGRQANVSELQAIYDFDGETNVSYMGSVITQMADILYPQLERPRPTVIPVGPDQDPHVRLARDLAARTRYFGVTRAYASFEIDRAELALLEEAYEALGGAEADVRCEEAADWLSTSDRPSATVGTTVEKLENAGKEPLRPRVRFLDRNATEAAFERLIETIAGEKRVFDAHVDAFEMDRATAVELAREVEVAAGGFGFVAPTSIYHRFMTGLTGGKMSSSAPASHISLLDEPAEGYEKVKSATTGGRETAAEQRERGGEAEACPVYELYAYLLAEGDDEYASRVYEECVGGERLCGGCKEEAAELMETFLEEHQEAREQAREQLADLDISLSSDRR
jgi:tryptophanyl-tRNA synthetase